MSSFAHRFTKQIGEILLRAKSVVHSTVARKTKRVVHFERRSLAELPRLNSLLSCGVEKRIHFRGEQSSLFLALAQLIFDTISRVALVQLYAIRTLPIAF